MKDYQKFQTALRETGSYSTPPERRCTRPARVSSFNSIRYALNIIKIVLRCSYRNVLKTFDYEYWAEYCFASVTFAEKLGSIVSFEGFEKRATYDGPVVYVSNHMSTLETMIYPAALTSFGKLAIIVKKSLGDIPFVGAAHRTVGAIEVTRKNAREDLATVLEQGSSRIASGSSVLLFPQGTRQSVFDAKRFNTLGAKLAQRNKVPLVPIAVQADFMQTGKIFKDFGRVDATRPIRFACGPVLPAEQGAKVNHAACIEFVENQLRAWGLPILDEDQG